VIRGDPGLGIGIVNRLADNLRQMGGGGSNPYGAVAILTPASARILYGFIPPLLGFQRRARA